MPLSLTDLSQDKLQRAEVYLQEYGDLLTVRELTGEEVLKARLLATERVGGTEGTSRVDPLKQRAHEIVFGMVDESLPVDLDQRAAKSAPIRKLGWITQLLLDRVIGMLAELQLSNAQRETLKSNKSAAEMLGELAGGPEVVEAFLEAQSEEDEKAILAVAVNGFPQALEGSLRIGVIRLLYAAHLADQQAQAERTALALARVLTPVQA
jgi:hypothetical protein